MAGISFNFRNTVASQKCAVSSPRIVSLEIGDESPGSESESFSDGFFINDQVSRNDVVNSNNLTCGREKQTDKNFLVHSQSTLSTSTDDHPSDKIKSTNDCDIDLDLLDLLNAANLEKAVESGAGNLNSKETRSYDKMKISNVEVCDGLSDLLSSIANNSSDKDESRSTLGCCQSKNAQDCDIGLLNFEIHKNGCDGFLLSSNSSLKVEGNLSEMLSSLNIEDSDASQVQSFNSGNMCNTKVVNKSEMEFKLPVSDLSDLLSCINVGDCNDSKIVNCNPLNMDATEETSELSLSDLLSSIDTDKSNKPTSTFLNSKALDFGCLNLYLKDTNDISDPLDDFTSDFGSSASSNNSCVSSDNEKENNSLKDSLIEKNLLSDKILESDSGYSSYDSVQKGFSFFDYSSTSNFSLNSLLTEKSETSIPEKHFDCADARNDNEEMSMYDLMSIVSPKFKNPCSESLSGTKKHENNLKKDMSSMQDLLKCLNINGSYVISDNSVDCDEKRLNYDCVNGKISVNIDSTIENTDILSGSLLEDALLSKSEFVNNDEQTTFIDLRECIKSAEPRCASASPIKECTSVEDKKECLTPEKILFYCEDKSPSDSSKTKQNPFVFDAVPRKKSRINTKQTLFSKALACKPKKDHSLLQKVTEIKNGLLSKIIHRPAFIDCDVPKPLVESVIQSDRGIFTNTGRIAIGLPASWESN